MNWRGVPIVCPRCRGDLAGGDTALACAACGSEYPVEIGIPDLRVFADPYIDPESDRAKGRHLAARFGDQDFAGLVGYYYSITPKVTPQQARLFTAGVLAAEARASASLDAWDAELGEPGRGALLEIGCGTGPLLVAARGRYTSMAGVDISFRWLTVGRKRLEEAKLDAPVFCACAEALPFAGSSFDRVAMDATLEMVRDRRAAIAECARALRSGGALMISTANRGSIGPDPHTGVWGGSRWSPERVDRYVRKRGGVAPVRSFLDAGRLRALLEEAGFREVRVVLPGIPAEQRQRFPAHWNLAAAVYDVARRLPAASRLLRAIGPTLLAVARR
jgi:ubiquinone/menaquinone biosynthesis C-methylase UbiE/uncharacterized protein YbaR (Trm112 family)